MSCHAFYVRCLSAVAGALMLLSTAAADGPTSDMYLQEIKPILKERCYACHGALKTEAGLRLDTAAAAIQGGDSGSAITPGAAERSLLIKRITASDEDQRMPPEGEPLTPAQIAAIRSWIDRSASAPANESPEPDPRAHWAFQPPRRPAVPAASSPEWQKNPIDAFIAAEHAARGLRPQAAADKRLWLRRVSLDLVGLPPTAAELDAFLADDSVEAHDRAVTRLLDSPQYGERWGRHWMDIWRYSDWWGLGAEVRNSQKHIWHWRDWIIDSLNADRGYDQMLREMLAADELYPNDLDKLRAGGFLARQYFKFNRTTWLDGVIEHTGKGMLGLTLNCAKCHDHKYDPISQTEYYWLRAIFEPYQIRTEALPGQVDFEQDGIPRPFDCNLDEPTYVHRRGDDRNPDTSRQIEPGIPQVLCAAPLAIEPVVLPAEAHRPGLRPFVVSAHRQAAEQRVTAAKAALAAAQSKLTEMESAARVAAATQAAGNDAPFRSPPADGVLIREDFSTERPNLWEQRGGDWSIIDGKLIQSRAGGMRGALRARVEVPRDFEARLRYTPTGGDQWKSVGITFDVTDAGNEVLAYLSSYAGGPKAQVSYLMNGKQAYPGEGAQGRPVDLNRPHDLVLRVRGQLVNLIVDDQPPVAYRLPIPRQRGALELITYDATAEFHSFELRMLPADSMLTVPAQQTNQDGKASTVPMTLDQARLAVVLAEKSLRTAAAELDSVQARAAADQARFLSAAGGDQIPHLIAEAARAQRSVEAARADEALTQAELDLLQAAVDKRPEAEKKLEAARAGLAKAQEALQAPGEAYPSLPGALKTLESNNEKEESRSRPFPTTSTGRRTAFARWLTDRENPLAARVAVNHIWSRHFGRPLVPTVFDFGRKGTPPTHPELLDWLAVEFMEQDWSMKHLHRLIVTSQTYRLSSSSAGADPATLAADPENRWYWRMNPLRMEAQVIRDSLLHLAGELDMTMGGPSIPVNEEQSRRRSLYFVHSHNDHQQFLSMFDDASVLDCYRRTESIVPQQALALENSSLATQMAERIAMRLNAEETADDEFVRRAFVTLLATPPTPEEQQVTMEALAQLITLARRQQQLHPEVQARIRLIQALLNHNDFVTIR